MRFARAGTIPGAYFVAFACSCTSSAAVPYSFADTCSRIDVQSILDSSTLERQHSDDASPKLYVSEPRASQVLGANVSEPITLIALGPVLGSMDSTSLQTELACTPSGIILTVTIHRSVNYLGSAAQNVTWRPRMAIAVLLHEPDAEFQVTWKMRRTDGADLKWAETPTYPPQDYPIVLRKMVHQNESVRFEVEMGP